LLDILQDPPVSSGREVAEVGLVSWKLSASDPGTNFPLAHSSELHDIDEIGNGYDFTERQLALIMISSASQHPAIRLLAT